MSPLRIALVGAGYWGPNLARNFSSSPDWELAAICDLDPVRAGALAAQVGSVAVTSSFQDLVADPGVDAVAIATPARTHFPLAMAALGAGKHVLVEKPLADSAGHGAQMVAAARDRGLVLMADHTYCYTPAVMKIRELVHDGSLGEILFVDSVRINLGLIQPDVNVFWDLAPHDLSILDYVLPGGLTPERVAAHGSDPLGAGRSCVGHLTLPVGTNGAMAHISVNWLSPTKIRQMVIGGTRRTLVWDDLNPQQRLSIYDRGVDLQNQLLGSADADPAASRISYRLGDTWAPALPEREALGAVVGEFAAAIRDGREALTSGASGLRVLSVLEAANHSLEQSGAPAAVLAAGLAQDRGMETVG